MKAIVGVAWDDPAKRYGTALTATFVKGKQASATNRESYTNTALPLPTPPANTCACLATACWT